MFLTGPQLAAFTPDTQDGNWYYGIVPRSTDGKHLVAGSTVWADVDKQQLDPKHFQPRASWVIHSGHGTQAMWTVDKPLDPGELVRLSRLAALAFEGDKQVCEPKRLLRLPGTTNNKDPQHPVPCVTADRCDVIYGVEDLADRFAAKFLARYWADGSRHLLSLALGASLARAGWTPERAEHLVRLICKMSGDRDAHDRVKAVQGTFDRREAGDHVSSAALRDALEDNYTELMRALGTSFRDGDILDHEGNVVGNIAAVEPDLANYTVDRGEYAYLDGHVVRWTGKLWQASSTQELLAYVFQLLERLRLYADGEDGPFPVRAKLAKSITDVTVGRLSSRSPKELDPDVIPLTNGLLRLGDRALLPVTRELAIRWVLPVAYDAAATAPSWRAFVVQAVGPMETYLQEWAGYCLTPGNPWQKMLWLTGDSGTGKSTFIGALTGLLGESVTAMSADHITDYTVATLAGKRVAVCAEIGARILKTAIMKSLVTGDPLSARHPYGRPFVVRFDGKIIWSSNSLPPPDEGEGVWRRIKVVPFDVKPDKEDPFLLRRILDDELPGLLNWALDGYDRVRGYEKSASWAEPAPVVALVGEYKEAANVFERFVEEELKLDKSATVPASLLYMRYSEWMREQGHTRVDPLGPAFWRSLRRAGLTPVAPQRVNGQVLRLWSGAELIAKDFIGGLNQ